MLLELLSLPNVQRGLLALLLASVFLPLWGISLVEQNLLPLRFMLLHGALLGGSVALVLEQPVFIWMVGVNALFVGALSFFSHRNWDMGRLSSFFMIMALGGASFATQLGGIGGQNLLGLLWGSPYLLTPRDLGLFALWGGLSLIFWGFFKKKILLLFSDSEKASTLGIRVKLLSLFLNLFLAFSMALGIKLLGVLLVDVLLIVPVLTGGIGSASFAQYIRRSLGISFILVLIGFTGSILYNWPLSGTIALAGGILFFFRIFGRRK